MADPYNRSMASDDFDSLAGELLLALPGIGDPRFEQAVIAMVLHQPDGAMGVGIGRIVPGLGLHVLLKQLGIEAGVAPDAPIHQGGPVETQRGFVLHSTDWRGEDTLPVSELLFETPTKERWPRAFATAGVDVRLLAPTSGHA
jgi:putative transcriptional regulator